MPGPRTRRTPRLRLGTTTARTQPILDDPPILPPVAAAIGGGLASALAGLLIVGGIVLIGWWGAVSVPVPAMLATIGQAWLLGNGAAVSLGSARLSLVPLGLTTVFVLLCAATAAFAQQQAVRAQPRPAQRRDQARRVPVVAAEVALGYVAGAIVVALLVGVAVPTVLPGAIGVGFLGGLAGAWWRGGHRLPTPTWLRAVLTGGLAGWCVLTVLAALALGVALVLGEPRIATLEQQLGLGVGGSLVWALIGLAYLPTLLGWTASWLLGAGFTIGDGSLVAPWVSQLGLLPSIPVLGALPGDGVTGLEPWLAAGALTGLVAGAAAVLVIGRPRSQRRVEAAEDAVTQPMAGAVRAPDSREATRPVTATRPDPVVALLAGAGAGLLVGLVFLAWAALSRGGLGVDRFAAVGPLFPQALIGVATLTLSAAVGAVLAWAGLVRRFR